MTKLESSMTKLESSMTKLGRSTTKLESSTAKQSKKKQWQWFIGLYLIGFICLVILSYSLKGVISFL